MPDSSRALTPQQELTVVAGLLHDLGHLSISTSGIELLGCVIDGPRDVSTLASMTDTAIASVSKKLTDLRQAGFVSYHVEGSRHVYQLAAGVRVISWDDHRVIVAKVAGGMLAIGISREILDRVRGGIGASTLPVVVRRDTDDVPTSSAGTCQSARLDETAPM